MFETVSIDEPRPGIHRLRLERRRKLNALDDRMMEELGTAAERVAERDPGAVVLEGAGRRSFSIGMDMRASFARTDDPTAGKSIAHRGQESMNEIASLPVPVVAAVQGFALGGGLELALTADVRIGGESSTFGLPEVTNGLIPGAGATQRLPTIVGRGRAYEMMFTGEEYEAGTMADWGLVDEVVEDDAVSEVALDWAEELSGASVETTGSVHRRLDPDDQGSSEGYMLEQSGLGRAFSEDPFGVSGEEG